MVGVIELSGSLAGSDGVSRPLNEAEHVRDAHFGGEIVHFVVEQKAQRAGGHVGAERVVESGGDGDGVAFAIDDRVVGGVVGLRAPAAGGFGSGWQESGGTDQRGRGRGRRPAEWRRAKLPRISLT